MADEEINTMEVFRDLHANIEKDQQRIRKAAAVITPAGVQMEVADTVLELLKDIVTQVAGAFEDAEGRLDDLEAEQVGAQGSVLVHEDGVELQTLLGSCKRLVGELLEQLPSEAGADARAELTQLHQQLTEWAEYAEEITDGEEDDDEEEGDEDDDEDDDDEVIQADASPAPVELPAPPVTSSP